MAMLGGGSLGFADFNKGLPIYSANVSTEHVPSNLFKKLFFFLHLPF